MTGANQDMRANDTEGDYWYSSLREAVNDLAPIIRPEQTLGLCGPWAAQVKEEWPYGPPPETGWELPYLKKADYVYVSPRGGECWHQLFEHGSRRPTIARVERGGGLIFELLGPEPARPPPRAQVMPAPPEPRVPVIQTARSPAGSP
jgi:hypothetical protein